MSDRRSEPRAAAAEDAAAPGLEAVAEDAAAPGLAETMPSEASPSLEAITQDILPALVARLRASRLGELEVRADGWRVRLRRAAAVNGPAQPSVAPAGAGRAGGVTVAGADVEEPQGSVVRSPAVGYVSLGADLVVGRSVQAGDSLGSVDVLGIRQDVAAPTDGVISRVLVEDDQAVEYGQVLAHVDPLGMGLVSGEAEDADAEVEREAASGRPASAEPR